MSFERILVPVDYSENSRRALELALSICGSHGVDVVHVWDRPSYLTAELTVNRADGTHRPLTELILENAERDMTEFLGQVTVPPGVTVRHRLVPGDPVAALLEQVSEHGYDLIVVGTHGRAGVTRLLLGSVTEKLIRLAAVPVLSVPPLRA